MSDGTSPQRKPRLLAAMVIGGLILLASVAYFILHNPYGPPRGGTDKGDHHLKENFLATARSALAKKSDLATSRTAVQLLNSHLQKAAEQPPALTPDATTRLRDQLGLSAEEVAEVAATTFTPLDAHHIDSCFLLRDAARSLEVPPLTGTGGKVAKMTPLDQAVAGFDWVVRQVRLSDIKDTDPSEQAPPAAILRRGIGSALQRSQVFLALLEQFGLDEADTSGLQGCLVFLTSEKGDRHLWACGVAVGNKPDSLYLFDPRVGLAIPGPGGKGVATLAQVRSDPAVLAQWKIDKSSYDVTPDQAKTASALVVVPLSAAAPRMRFLQDRLLRDRSLNEQFLPAPVRVRLAEDPEQALGVIRQGVGQADKVHIWKAGSGTLRRFIASAEGGADQSIDKGLPAIQVRFQFNAMHWEEFPPALKQLDKLGQELSLRLRLLYALPFLRSLADSDSPRELLLRGRFLPAVQDLVREQEQLQQSRFRLEQAGDLDAEIAQWIVNRAIPTYANLIRARGTPGEAAANAQVEQLWRWKIGEPIEVLLNGSIAGPRGAEVMYQLALCRHEQAIRLQQRVDLAASIGLTLASDAANPRPTWLDAAAYWKQFLDGNPTRPGVAAAQCLRAEALVHIGEKEEAAKLWKDTRAKQTDLERLGRMWKAR